ncbi:hypothetical protein FNV43_RR21462 [Rhamnella rubrinervis]|uniref:Uncharacterized protein n=1 Tax=Rhamnella rubrinervis TaxID=2594499 RepID=A0A8K0E0S3_9ROSA|nr:hypothetical protein FNV43_RR21462 [Rhamnella rubrinervis]
MILGVLNRIMASHHNCNLLISYLLEGCRVRSQLVRFVSGAPIFGDDLTTGVRYRDLFNMMVDAVISAMAVVGHENILGCQIVKSLDLRKLIKRVRNFSSKGGRHKTQKHQAWLVKCDVKIRAWRHELLENVTVLYGWEWEWGRLDYIQADHSERKASMLSTDLVWIESIHAVKSSAKWDRDGEAGLVTFHFFPWKEGTPFGDDQGIYNKLTWWEQIDSGKQLARTRKFLTVVPLVLARAVVQRFGGALEEQESVSEVSKKQDVKELIEEVQEARRIKLLHQPSKLRQDPCNLFHVLAKIKISPRTVCLGDYEMILILELHTQEWRLGPTLLILCEHLFVSFAICTLRKQTNKFTAGFKWKNDLDSDMVKQLSVLKRNRRWLSSFGVGASATFCCQAF